MKMIPRERKKNGLAGIMIAFLLHTKLVKGLFEKAGCKF